MSETDWMKRSFLIISSFLVSCVLIGTAVMYGKADVYVPYAEVCVTVSKVWLLSLGAICLGVQNHTYELQKKIIETIARGLE
jgi:hypothetical protein